MFLKVACIVMSSYYTANGEISAYGAQNHIEMSHSTVKEYTSTTKLFFQG